MNVQKVSKYVMLLENRLVNTNRLSHIFQFLIAVRTEGAQLTSADGETTSHLMGTFYRTIRMIENGIKPVYVFDGKVKGYFAFHYKQFCQN